MERPSATKVREYQGHAQAIYNLAPALQPGHFLSCGAEGIVAEWNIETGNARALVKAENPIYAILPVPDAELLLLGLRNGELVFADLAKGSVLRRVQLHKAGIFDLQLFPDGKNVLVSGEDGAVSVWNLERLDHLHYQRVAPKSIRTIAFSPKGDAVALGSSDAHIRILDMGLTVRQDWKAHLNSVFRVRYAPDGAQLVSTGRDAHISTWAAHEGYGPLQSVPAHLYAVNDLVWHPNQHHLFSASMDKSIKLWKLDGLELLKVVNFEKHGCHRNGVNRLLWHEGILYSCGDDRRIMAWAFEGGV